METNGHQKFFLLHGEVKLVLEWAGLPEDEVSSLLYGTSDCTVVPVMNGHPRDQAKVSIYCRWPLIRGTVQHV